MDKVYVIGRDPVPSLLRLDSPQELRLTFVALPGACGKVSVEVDIDSAGRVALGKLDVAKPGMREKLGLTAEPSDAKAGLTSVSVSEGRQTQL